MDRCSSTAAVSYPQYPLNDIDTLDPEGDEVDDDNDRKDHGRVARSPPIATPTKSNFYMTLSIQRAQPNGAVWRSSRQNLPQTPPKSNLQPPSTHSYTTINRQSPEGYETYHFDLADKAEGQYSSPLVLFNKLPQIQQARRAFAS